MMRRSILLVTIVMAAFWVPPGFAQWRSSLYPADWVPGLKDAQGRFLHDFSYAGYHRGEADIPADPPGRIIDVTQAPYYADSTGLGDATDPLQAAIDAAGAAGGGIVFLPAGVYRVKPAAGADYTLRISRSGVVLRGAGPEETFLFNDDTSMREKSIILVGSSSSGWHTPLSGSEVKFTRDVEAPAHVIPVTQTTLPGKSTLRFNPGDWVILRMDCTEGFIADHGMTGRWDASLKGITFYRQVTGVDPVANTLTVDIPTRYVLKTRDNARVYKIAPPVEEVGVEHLSIGNRENPAAGLGSNDYNVSGTAAYQVHASHCIEFSGVVNGWIQDVRTYRPLVNTHDWHVLSNIILLSQSRSVTVRDCVIARPQYEGGGGNGYGYTLRSNDCLVANCTAFHCRHNYNFKSMWTSGNVILGCTARDGQLSSDFHMHLSPANLYDSTTVDGDFLQAVYRASGTVVHGHSTSASVYWNTYGTARCGPRVIVSRQWNWGYVIGTSGPTWAVERGVQDNTAPEDVLEGQGQGETLVPQSLYLDQLARRRGMDLDFSGRVDLVDFSLLAQHWMRPCTGSGPCHRYDFDGSGRVAPLDLAAFAERWLAVR